MSRSHEQLCATILALPEEEQSAAMVALFGRDWAGDCETALRRARERADQLAEGETR